MNFFFLLDICGVPFLVVIAVLCLGLSLAALHLTFKTRSKELLSAFLPLTLFPLFAGLASTLTESVTAISLQLDDQNGMEIEPAFVLQMSLVPLLFSAAACCIPATIAIAGKFSLAWKDSGARLFQPKETEEKATVILPEDSMQKDADAYLERLTRAN